MNLIKNYNAINKNYNFYFKKIILDSFKKDYIVQQKINEKDIFYIHKNNSIYSFFNKKKKNQIKIGFSISRIVFNFKHVLNSFLKIKIPLSFVTPNINCIFKKKLFIFSFLLKKKKNVLLLNPRRGGFMGFYVGLFGFIPKKDIKKIISFLYLKKNFLINKNLNFLLIKLTVNNYCKNYFYKIFFLKNFRLKILLLKIPLSINKFTLKSSNYNSDFLKFENFLIDKKFKIIFSYTNKIKSI
jgi:hypothetical protein